MVTLSLTIDALNDFTKLAGAYRFVYNWGLEKIRNGEERDLYPILKGQITKNPDLSWLGEVNTGLMYNALSDVSYASEDGCFPPFRKKRSPYQQFSLEGEIIVGNGLFVLPDVGTVHMADVDECDIPEGTYNTTATLYFDGTCWTLEDIV